MRFVLLTHNLEHYSNRRLIEAARARRHEVLPVDASRCTLLLTGERPEVHVEGEALRDINAVIARPRIGWMQRHRPLKSRRISAKRARVIPLRTTATGPFVRTAVASRTQASHHRREDDRSREG